MSQDAEKILKELLEEPTKAISQDSLQSTIEQLEGIARADPGMAWGDITTTDEHGNLIVSQGQLAPKDWPMDLRNAVESMSPNAHGVSFRLAAKGRTLEALARIKGAYSEESKAQTPLEALLAAIPRQDLLTVVTQLKFLVRQPTIQPAEEKEEKEEKEEIIDPEWEESF